MDIAIGGQPVYIYDGGKSLVCEALADLPIVVFIHGAEQDHSCWSLQSRWFAHHAYAVLAPDLPAHGRSGGDPLTSIEALADWVVGLLDTLGVAQATLIGHSMGALVALEVARAHPERLARLALIGCAVPMPVSDRLLDAARSDEARAAALINDFSYTPGARLGGSAIPGMWLLGASERLMARQKPGVFATDLGACNAYARSVESLAMIDVPLLVIGGSDDRMTPESASRALAAAVPGARLTIIAGGGHALLAEKPDVVLDSLRGFLVCGP